MPLGGAQLAHDAERSPTTVPSVGMLRHVRLRAILDRKFRNFFAGRAQNCTRPQQDTAQRSYSSLPGAEYISRARLHAPMSLESRLHVTQDKKTVPIPN